MTEIYFNCGKCWGITHENVVAKSCEITNMFVGVRIILTCDKGHSTELKLDFPKEEE